MFICNILSPLSAEYRRERNAVFLVSLQINPTHLNDGSKCGAWKALNPQPDPLHWFVCEGARNLRKPNQEADAHTDWILETPTSDPPQIVMDGNTLQEHCALWGGDFSTKMIFMFSAGSNTTLSSKGT